MTTLPLILNAVRSLGHQVFTAGDHNLNIIAVRTPTRVPDRFDDWIVCAYREGGAWVVRWWEATTDPGLYWLQHPMNVKGTAILMPGQYRGAYAIGLHRNRYDALVQQGPVRVWRDADRDQVLDHEAPDSAWGINIHRAGESSTRVHKWSAGCLVFRRARDFHFFMQLCQRAAQLYGNSFTLTLVESEDLIRAA